MAHNNYRGFYNLYPQSSNYYEKLNSDFEKHKNQRIDNEMSKNYKDDYFFSKINEGNNYKQNKINEKRMDEILNWKFEKDIEEAIKLSIKEEEERKLTENKTKEEIEKKKLNDDNLNKKNPFDNNPLKNEINNKIQNENKLDNKFNVLNNIENLINKNQLNSTIENKTINTIEYSKQNEKNEDKINTNNNEPNINFEKNSNHNNNLINNNNNIKLNNPKELLKESMPNLRPFNAQDLLNNSNTNDKDFDIDNNNNITIKKKNVQNINNIINNDNNDNQVKRKKIKIINDCQEKLNQNIISSTRSQSISKKQPEPLIYVPLQNPPGHNSCYIHSTIHILFHCTDFSKYILQLNKNPIINNKLIRALVKIFHDYLSKSQEKTTLPEEYKYIYNSLETFNFRYELGLYSKQRFKLYLMGDPVELLIYLLENCSEIDSNLIHDLFYIDIREQYICNEDRLKEEIKYDKDNFVREIYIEEILNFLEISEMAFEDFKNQLFTIFKEVSYQHVKKCKKCNLVMQKITVCYKLPKYFLINCVWSNKNPSYENIIKFFSMIPFNFNSNDMFDIKCKKSYSLFGFVLYCYHLAHYINVIYDNKKGIFILYSDEFILKIKNIEELYDYLTGKTKKDEIFYPVLLVYQENSTENKKKLEIDYKFYQYLMEKVIEKIKENNQQKDNILNNTINEKKDNSIQELNNTNIPEIKIENSNNEDLKNNNEDKISIVDHMMNKVNNLYYYNELNKKYEQDVQRLKLLEKEKKTNPNEDLNTYKNNLKKEKNNRSMTQDKNKYPNYDRYQKYLVNVSKNENQKKDTIKSTQKTLIHRGRGQNNNTKQSVVKPNIKKNNNETKNINKYQTINSGNSMYQNNEEMKNKHNTMNSFNRGTKAKNQNYIGNTQRINYTKFGCP